MSAVMSENTVGTENMLPCEVCISQTSSEVAANFESLPKSFKTGATIGRSCAEV